MYLSRWIKSLVKADTHTAQFLRFCIIGGIATCLHYGIYLLLQPWINVNVAYTIGYFISFIGNFFATNYFTFHTIPSWKKMFGFGGGHLINWLLHLCLLNLFIYLGVNKLLAPAFVLAIAVPCNFFIQHFVFRGKMK